MSYIEVQNQLEKYGLDKDIQILPHSSATVALAAETIGVKEAQIAKTMAFMVKEKPILIVMEGTARLDNHKYKSFFHAKAKMMSAEELKEYIDHEPGGVCPFGVRDNVLVYFDISLKHWDTVWPAAGLHNNCVRITLEDMKKVVQPAAWIDVTKEE